MAKIIYESTKLQDMNKSGRISAESDGYYTVPLGGLNVLNSAQEFYRLQGSDELFRSSSTFQRSVKEKAVLSENGHPEQNGTTDQVYLKRLLRIDQQNVTNHIGEVWLDDTLYKQHPELLQPKAVAIMGKVKPYGPFASMCSDAITNPKQNLCYSIRCFTANEEINGRIEKILKHIVNFDLVYLPGIECASKYNSPDMQTIVTLNPSEGIITSLESIVTATPLELDGLTVDMQSANTAKSVLSDLRSDTDATPIYIGWAGGK